MAFTYVGDKIGVNNKVSGLSVSGVVTVTVAAGDLMIVAVGMDNVQTTDGDATDFTVTDSQGNGVGGVYTRIREFVNGNGAAGAGTHVGLFYAILAAQLTVSVDTITAARGATNVDAKALCGGSYTIGAGKTVVVDDVTTRADDGVNNPGALTLGSLANIEHLFISVFAHETTGFGTNAPPANYTNSLFFTSTSGGAADTNVGCRGQGRILTATGDTADWTGSAGTTDWASILAALSEVSGGSIVPLSMQHRKIQGMS